MNYELAWRQRVCDNRLTYGINAFYIHADNIIQTVNRKNINTGELHNVGIEADLQLAINAHWSVTTNHSLLHMKQAVVAAPTYKGYLGANYQSQSWGVHVGLTQVAGLYTAIGDNEQKENITLLNATIDYHLNRYLTLWVKGDNLLGQHYQFVLGNPMPKATFMGGVKITL